MKNKDIFNLIVNIDRLVHEPARTAILALLIVVEEVDFTFLMNKTGLSQGNLSSHLTKLEDAGIVEIRKTFKGKRPNTIVSISPKGRVRFKKYISDIKEFAVSF